MDGIHDCVTRHHKPPTGFGSPCLELRVWAQCAKNDTTVATDQLIRKKSTNAQRILEVFDYWGQNVNMDDSLRAMYVTIAIKLGRLTLFGE
jgi:hypothetical protein